MSLLDLFRRPPPVADAGGLEDFIDQRASFMIQKSVFEYSRARAGIMWEKLFKEPGFKEAIDVARWRGYPIALANVTEMVEGVLRPYSGDREAELLSAILRLSKAVIHRYPVPPHEPAQFWAEAEAWLERRLGDIQDAPPKPVKDIPLSTAQQMFDLLPIHPSIRTEDFVMVRNHLRTNLCRMYEDFIERADLDPLVADVLTPDRPVRLPAAGHQA
jgi:hypothetical protein